MAYEEPVLVGTYEVQERWSSRKQGGGSSKGASVEYIIRRTDETPTEDIDNDDTEALKAFYDYLHDNTLLTWNDLPYISHDIEQQGERLWFGTVNYGYGSGGDRSKIQYTFDTGGGTQKITQTVSPLSVRSYGTNAPNFQGAINVDDNSVNGIDIIVPVYNFSLTKFVDDDDMDDAFKSSIFSLTGKVNSGSWEGYAAGEVLFLGASGSKHGKSGDWEINYKFAASPNKTNISIGSISGITKKGWEYLWVRYEKSTDQNCLIQIPKAVYVHEVYESGDFDALDLSEVV